MKSNYESLTRVTAHSPGHNRSETPTFGILSEFHKTASRKCHESSSDEATQTSNLLEMDLNTRIDVTPNLVWMFDSNVTVFILCKLHVGCLQICI